jgi:hypothetical protein
MRAPQALAGFVLVVGAAFAWGCGSSGSANTNDGDGSCPRVVLDGGGVIPNPPDGASLCPAANICNYQAQTGCPAGESCRAGIRPNTEDIIAFCEAAGSGSDDDPCTTAMDCGVGYICPADHRCHQLCCGRDWSESACNPGFGCYRQYLFDLPSGVTPTGAYVCDRVGCDVLTSDDCPSDFDCKIIDPRGTTACVPPTTGTVGERCTGPLACGRRLSCIGDPGEETCRHLCRAEECGQPACGPT